MFSEMCCLKLRLKLTRLGVKGNRRFAGTLNCRFVIEILNNYPQDFIWDFYQIFSLFISHVNVRKIKWTVFYFCFSDQYNLVGLDFDSSLQKSQKNKRIIQKSVTQ